MHFAEIEARRVQAGISQYALCHRAGVHTSTYYRRLRDRDDGRGLARTLQKLARALDQLTAQRRAAKRRKARSRAARAA